MYASVRSRISGGSLLHLQRRVDAGHQSLARGFFVAGGAVDLAAEEQARDLAGFERALQFRGIDGVVFDGVAGPQHLGVLEAGDRLQNLQLDFDRQGSAHAVDVNFVRVQALRFEEELVHFLVGKLHDLVFDRRTVARADRLDLSAVHGRAVHVFADDAMRLRRGARDVARHLRVVMRDALRAKAERRGIDVAGLLGEARPVDAASIEARRSAGFEAASAQAEILQRLAQQDGVGLAGASRQDIAARRSGSGR